LILQLELKIPPPVIAATVAAGMVAVALWVGPVLNLPMALRMGGALALAAMGACFDLAGIWAFRKAKTTVNPMAPQRSAKLVANGVYRMTRNPMYLGLVLILLGLALYLASPWALLGPLAFAAYITRFQIFPEERALTAHFGAAYTAYCAQVRRWL
jgi:protein-S-isoprenylcysteine O-methyltransferase Ste14